jgi:folate-binding protein YgfZ
MKIETRGTADNERAHAPLQNGAILVDRSARLRMLFSGDKAAESLTGLLTNDINALTPGLGQYAAALTPKGKVLADVRIFARPDGLLVDTSAAAAPGFASMIRKFVNPRLAKYQNVTALTCDIGVFGGTALDVVRAAFPNADVTSGLAPYSHVDAPLDSESLMIASVPDFGVAGFDIIGPRSAIDELNARLARAGAIHGSADALQFSRIEAGRPEYGVDMDDTMLAQEVDMDRLEAISYTKGCYTGQETVARVHHRGHVNRLLRGLRFADAVLPPVGAPLADASGKDVGTVRSGAVSPRGGAIALAIVRREIEPGANLHARWSEQRADARVESLPFRD